MPEKLKASLDSIPTMGCSLLRSSRRFRRLTMKLLGVRLTAVIARCPGIVDAHFQEMRQTIFGMD